MNKKNIRKNILIQRKNKKHSFVNFYSLAIINKIIKKFNLIHKKIGIYFPINNEINSLLFFDCKNILYVPTIIKNKIIFCKIENKPQTNINIFSKNKNNYKSIPNIVLNKNIPELKIKKNTLIPEIIFVPIVAFDKKCFRIGYGGGFYDRYLKNKNILKIGIAFEFQKEMFHVEHHDVQLDYIFTEKKIYKKPCKKLFQI